MKCHSGKKLKGKICDGELQTKRTLAGPDGTVRRERYCPECQTQQWTVEMFEDDLKAEREKASGEIRNLNRQVAEASREAAEIKRAGKQFFQLIGVAS